MSGPYSGPPLTWQWTRLGTIASYIQRGKSPKYAVADGSPVVSQKCVQWNGIDISVAKQITLDSLKNYDCIRFLRDGDLLWNSTGTGTIGRVIRLIYPPDKLVCDGHVTVVRCLEVDSEYIRTWLRTDHVYGVIEEHAAGATNQVELTARMANEQLVPLPPLAEQHRIVVKLDELMALCDRLEESRSKREDTRDRLTKASYARVGATDTDDTTFRSYAHFAADVLPALTARADQVGHLRQTILNLAVRGRLVEQDPADEPASELLKQIEVERAETPKAKKSKSYPLKAGAYDGDLFDLPTGWECVPLARISDVTMGQSPPGDTYNKSGDGVPLINGPVEFTPGPFGRTIVNQYTTAPTNFCEEGDLLICVRGSTTGRTNVAAFRACIGRGVAAICSTFDDGFIRLFLWKAREDIISMGRGVAFPSISKKQLENLAIPLSPSPSNSASLPRSMS